MKRYFCEIFFSGCSKADVYLLHNEIPSAEQSEFVIGNREFQNQFALCPHKEPHTRTSSDVTINNEKAKKEGQRKEETSNVVWTRTMHSKRTEWKAFQNWTTIEFVFNVIKLLIELWNLERDLCCWPTLRNLSWMHCNFLAISVECEETFHNSNIALVKSHKKKVR